jgi:intracellular septation protein A
MRYQTAMLWNLGFNIALPTLVLIQAGSLFGWSPSVVLVVALLGPLGYGGFELATKRKVNHVSVLGLVSVLLTGGIGLLELDKGWIAVKEAAVPSLLGVGVLVSAFTPWPVVKTFLFNAEVLDVPRIEQALNDNDTVQACNTLLKRGTIAIAGSFVVSAVLNYFLAAYIVVSEAGTEAFNTELGQLTAWSVPVIVVPSMVITLGVMYWLMKGLSSLTGMDIEELVTPKGDHDEE